ncbi:MAG TPA: 23S rRNA (pseudouridine(1915)-N(3))-methyltransferase RlmH [Geminicoccaceae bacterium]|nr:23S rRNA (pseudouridine(1915)-N(3))-methyltransferase RlmH [Geminicoccaceae bacterium]
MRMIVAAVGRDRAGPTRDLFDDYCRRSPWPIRLVEIAPRTDLPIERRLREEAEGLLKAVPPGAVLAALDEAGRQLDSAGLARRIARWQQDHDTVAFAIGGPDGLARSVLNRAQATLAFGRMTWPHRLVRVMLAEQIYRAGTILSGHPYHRA